MGPQKRGRRVLELARRFCADYQAVAAVEFALILPFLLILLIGMSESTEALNADRKVSQVASSMTDLIAQAESVTTDDINELFNAADYIMEPFPITDLDIIVASVTFDGEGDPIVDWSHGAKSNSPWPAGDAPPVDIPEGLGTAGASIVVGRTTYTHNLTFGTLLQNTFPRATSINMSATYFLKPRITTKVILE